MTISVAREQIERQDVPTAPRIQAELERMLASRTFHNAEAQKRFLRYVVEKTIGGEANQIKEISVGIEVFERGRAFDPRMDNIVRVEARKLRARVARYYETEGSSDPIRIVFPPRGYVPTFVSAADLPEPVVADPAPKQFVSPSGSGPDDHDITDAKHGAVAGGFTSLVRDFPRDFPWFAAAAAVVLTLIFAAGLFLLLRKSSRAVSAQTPSIAVLPFRNLGDIRQDASFSDGLTDELIDSLGIVQGLRVVARTSAFQFRGSNADIREIGRKLNVRIVLEGSVGKYGDRLRISAQLDDVTNGLRVWSASYDRDTKDILNVQREISQAIVDAFRSQFSALNLKLGPAPAEQSLQVDPEAYRDYLQGVYFWNKNTAAGLTAAIKFFEQAIAKDPGYARAYAGLARCYVGLPSFSVLPAQEAASRIREMAAKSLALDSGQGEAHIYLGYAAMLTYDWRTAEREFRTGLERDPGDAVAHRWHANYLLSVGQVKQALEENKVAEDLDPVSPYMIIGTARTLLFLDRNDEAIAHIAKALLLDPNFGGAHQLLGVAYVQKKMYPEAINELKIAQHEMGQDPARIGRLGYAYAASGQTAEARAILNGLLSESRPAPARAVSLIYVGLGDKDHAFQYLREVVNRPGSSLMLKADPVYSSLRTDPRYRELLESIGLQ